MKRIIVKFLQYSLQCIYYISLSAIVLRLLIFIIELIFIVKIINYEFGGHLEIFKFYALPIGIICAFFGAIKKNDTNIRWIEKLTITIILTFIAVCFSIFSAFSGMCDYTITKNLFIKVNDTTNKIVETRFGCGAYDSSPERVDILEIHSYFNCIVFLTRTDTTELERSSWIVPREKEKLK